MPSGHHMQDEYAMIFFQGTLCMSLSGSHYSIRCSKHYKTATWGVNDFQHEAFSFLFIFYDVCKHGLSITEEKSHSTTLWQLIAPVWRQDRRNKHLPPDFHSCSCEEATLCFDFSWIFTGTSQQSCWQAQSLMLGVSFDDWVSSVPR